MNKIFKTLGFACVCLLATSACSEISFGDSFLGEAPESSGATTEQMFAEKKNAEKVLVKAYTALPYGLPVSLNKMGGNVLESLTDLCHSFRDNISDGPMKYYYNGSLSANNCPNFPIAYRYGGRSDWTTIRYAWLFIENVDKVPDMTPAEKAQRKAEAKILIALSYFEMFRYVGGVSWLDHAVDVNEEMNFPRLTFAQTVSNIEALLQQAIDEPNLPWKQDENNDGRMTKAAAMALKFKLLHFAASPTFNSNTKWHPEANEYTCYGNEDPQRWQAAMAAGKAFFDALAANGGYELVQPEEQTANARRLAYRKAYYQRGTTENIISTRKGKDANGLHSDYIDQRYYSGPTLNYVNMFSWADGTEFPADFDWKKPAKDPFFKYNEKTEEMEPTRDPRLYENVACPGDLYCNETPAPVYSNAPTYKNGSGFLIMKYILQKNADRGTAAHWCHTRLAEIMLGYAEAICMVNGKPNDEAYRMVNDIRARVGLSELPARMSKDDFIEAVLKERAMELGFEEVRWFDLVRWNRKADFTKTLYGLRSRGNDENHPTSFKFEVFELPTRNWKNNWDSKWYLAPIPQDEINKEYGMTQNPGW